MFYALSYFAAGDDPKEYTHGFANTKGPLAFRTKDERDDWLKSTKLLTARAITRKEAASMAKWENGEHYGKRGETIKVIRIYSGDSLHNTNYAIVARK